MSSFLAKGKELENLGIVLTSMRAQVTRGEVYTPAVSSCPVMEGRKCDSSGAAQEGRESKRAKGNLSSISGAISVERQTTSRLEMMV